MPSMTPDHASAITAVARQPPLHALHVFAIAVRMGSFTRAAGVLGVTQGAVSRQVKQLEESLGIVLFVRHKRGLRPTPDAETLFAVVDEAFSRVLDTCDSLRTSGQTLTIRVPPTLAVRWFLPLLPSLRAMMPGVDIRVTTDDGRGRSLDDSGIDAAIIYGRGDWPHVEAVPLLPERLSPVCAPSVARRLGAPRDLEQVPLLQCAPLTAWGRWLAEAKAGWRAVRHEQTFDTLELALSAATRGQGVALGDLNLLQESLRDGVLVAPFDCVLDQGIAYYLAYPATRAAAPKIRSLRAALLAAIAP